MQAKVLPKECLPIAIRKLNKIFALELDPHTIRVNSVNHWLIPTGMSKPFCTEEYFQGAVNKTPLGNTKRCGPCLVLVE